MMEFLKLVPAVIGRLVVSVMFWAPSGHISCRISSSLQPIKTTIEKQSPQNNQSEAVTHKTYQQQLPKNNQLEAVTHKTNQQQSSQNNQSETVTQNNH